MISKYFKTKVITCIWSDISNLDIDAHLNIGAVYKEQFWISHNYWRKIIAWETTTTKQATKTFGKIAKSILGSYALQVAILHPH